MEQSHEKKNCRSITTKLVFLILVFSTFATLITAAIQIHSEYDDGLGLIIKRIEQIEQSSMKSLAATFWDIDEERLMVQLKGLSSLPDIEKVEIRGSTENFSVGRIKSKKIYERKMPIIYTDPRNKQKKNKLGELVITAGLDPLNSRLGNVVMTILITQGIQIFLVGAFLLLIFQVLVTKHLKRMAQYLGNMDVVRLSGKLRLERRRGVEDEFTLVVNSINKMTEKLHDYTANLQYMIEEKTKNISSILNTIEQGIFTILPNIKVNEEYSSYLKTILETDDISGRDVMDLLFKNTNLNSDTLSQILSALVASIGEESFAFDMNSHLLIKELHKKFPSGKNKILELDWNPVINANEITEKIMVTVRNVTELRQLQTEAREKERELEIIGEIISVPVEKFQEFVNSAREILMENREIILNHQKMSDEALNILFRNMHTLKGMARFYNFLYLCAPIHDIEQVYEDMLKKKSESWQQKLLLDQLDGLYIKLNEYVDIHEKKLARSQTSKGFEGNEEKWKFIHHEELVKNLPRFNQMDIGNLTPEQIVLWKRMLITLNLLGTDKLEDILSTILDSLTSLSRELGKERPKLTFEDKGIYLKHEVHKMLRNIFTHIIRNTMDHGIEPVAERLVKGKEARGQINFTLSIEKNSLIIIYKDDGKGLNLDFIRKKGESLGLIKKNEPLGPEDLSMLIFSAGLTTAKMITHTSGRGMGMDAVKKFLEKSSGRIKIRLLDGPQKDEGHRPFEIIISLPKEIAVDIHKFDENMAA